MVWSVRGTRMTGGKRTVCSSCRLCDTANEQVVFPAAGAPDGGRDNNEQRLEAGHELELGNMLGVEGERPC